MHASPVHNGHHVLVCAPVDNAILHLPLRHFQVLLVGLWHVVLYVIQVRLRFGLRRLDKREALFGFILFIFKE